MLLVADACLITGQVPQRCGPARLGLPEGCVWCPTASLLSVVRRVSAFSPDCSLLHLVSLQLNAVADSKKSLEYDKGSVRQLSSSRLRFDTRLVFKDPTLIDFKGNRIETAGLLARNWRALGQTWKAVATATNRPLVQAFLALDHLTAGRDQRLLFRLTANCVVNRRRSG